MEPKKLLVLDLDETLIHATETMLSREADFRVGHLYVYKRPQVHKFISSVLKGYRVAVWTASDAVYAATIVSKLFPANSLEFVLSRQHCTLSHNWDTREDQWIKKVKRLKRRGYSVDSIVAVDDTASGYARSYGNLIVVQAFIGDPHDNELMLLATYLDHLVTVPNVRSVEKRNWRLQVQGKTKLATTY